MKLKHIKANGKYYRPQKPGEQDPSRIKGCNYPVCFIKKLMFGRWQVDFYDELTQFIEKGGYSYGDEDKPNTRLIIYPSGVEEIEWLI